MKLIRVRNDIINLDHVTHATLYQYNDRGVPATKVKLEMHEFEYFYTGEEAETLWMQLEDILER